MGHGWPWLVLSKRENLPEHSLSQFILVSPGCSAMQLMLRYPVVTMLDAGWPQKINEHLAWCGKGRWRTIKKWRFHEIGVPHGTPKSCILKGFCILQNPLSGMPICGNPKKWPKPSFGNNHLMLEVVVPRKGERHWQNQPDLILTVRINYSHEHDEPQPILSFFVFICIRRNQEFTQFTQFTRLLRFLSHAMRVTIALGGQSTMPAAFPRLASSPSFSKSGWTLVNDMSTICIRSSYLIVEHHMTPMILSADQRHGVPWPHMTACRQAAPQVSNQDGPLVADTCLSGGSQPQGCQPDNRHQPTTSTVAWSILLRGILKPNLATGFESPKLI